MDIDTIPKSIIIEELQVKFAPKDYEVKIDNIVVKFMKGLEVKGNFKLFFGLKNSEFHLTTVQDNEGFNFLADIELNLPTIASSWANFMSAIFPHKQLQKPINSFDEEKSLMDYIRELAQWMPQLTQLSVKDFNFRRMMKKQANFNLGIKVLFRGEEHEFNIGVGFKEAIQPLSFIFTDKVIEWKDELDISPTKCLINGDCPSNQKCLHLPGDDRDSTCVDECDGTLGEVPYFGCAKCVSSAECVNNKFGNCCDNGHCVASDDEYCGMCRFGYKCNSPHSGCFLAFCTECIRDFECRWNGSAGNKCINGQCK